MVAVKLVDLEELSSSLELLIKEAHTMKGLRHPNVLPMHCSFVADSALWLVMPYIGGGTVSQLLRSQVNCTLSTFAHKTVKMTVNGTVLSNSQGSMHVPPCMCCQLC